MTPLKTQFFDDRPSWFIWSIIAFCASILFYFKFPYSSYFTTISAFIIILISFYLEKNSVFKIFYIPILIFIFGYFWAKFYENYFIKSNALEYNIYGNVIGEIEKITKYQNNTQIILKKIEISQAKSKSKKRKKIKKQKKPNQKFIKNNFFNYKDFQEINRDFNQSNFAPDKIWQNGLVKNPPHKIKLNLKNLSKNLQIGDKIKVTAFLRPTKDQYSYFKQIGGYANMSTNVQILQQSQVNSLMQNIDKWRLRIADKILSIEDSDSSRILVSLLIGEKSFIAKEIVDKFRHSGTSHLIAISGLHMAIISGIFFFLIRLGLSFNQNITLHYDIKKISAIAAIIASLCYLMISGFAISAIRSFIMISMFFIAVLLNREISPKRILAMAALIILLINPSNIFSIGFHLSFFAVLALIAAHEIFVKIREKFEIRYFWQKFLLYFFTLAFSSTVIDLFLLPFLTYHFGYYANYSIFANIFVIPFFSFLVMPMAFVALLLLPFFDSPVLLSANLIDILIRIIAYFYNMPNSVSYISEISQTSLMIIIFGILWLSFWQYSWRFLGLLVIIIGLIVNNFKNVPKLIIDPEKSFFAIYDNKNGLKFSKIYNKPTFKQKKLMQKTGTYKYEKIKNNQKIFCNKKYCLIDNKTLIVKKRMKKSEICNFNVHKIINMTKYYILPDC